MRRLVPALTALAIVLTVTQPRARDADDAEKARRDAVVLRIGPKAITVADLESRLAKIPRFQLQSFGATADEVRTKFLHDVVIPETLLALGAEDRHLDRDLVTAHALERARSNATLRAVRAEVGPAAAIPLDEVKRYFEENRARFDAPERINVWRILCKSRDEATVVLDAAKKEPTLTAFATLAREHSLDKATALRGGNLGFLAPDGSSNEAGLKVDPTLVKAAHAVRDGDFVSTPVPEAAYFAVVWRRGTLPATRRTVDEVAGQIRDLMWREKKERAEKKLIEDLRARDLHSLNDAILGTIDVSSVDGAVTPRRRPGQVPPLQASPPPTSSK